MPDIDALQMEVGRIGGKQEALLTRVDRIEQTVADALREINSKLDVLMAARAERHGQEITTGAVLKGAMWLVAALSGWVVTAAHLLSGHPPAH